VHSLERALGLLERELSVHLPRALWLPGGAGPDAEPLDPELLLDPNGGLLRGGELLPDALPFAHLHAGGELALRFDGTGAPREVIRAGPGPAWHPSGDAPTFPSEPDRHRRRAEDALDCGLARLARAGGEGALARDLGVTREAFADWLLDARLVPEPSRASLRRLTGQDDAALFEQDWDGAAHAAARAAALRPELAWPGALAGFHAEGLGRNAEAAAVYAAALRGFATTLDLAGRLFARPLVKAPEALGRALERHRPPGGPAGEPDPELDAALLGADAARTHALAASDAARARGRHGEAWVLALRAGWWRHRAVDMDDVLGRMLWAAESAGSAAHAALARHHLRAWSRRG